MSFWDSRCLPSSSDKNLFSDCTGSCNWLHACNCFSAPHFWAFPYPPHGLKVAEQEVFAQHFRAGRIPSPWCVMNILLYCYVIYAQGLGLKAPSLHTLITRSSSLSVFISQVFILLYKQEQSAPVLEVISGWFAYDTQDRSCVIKATGF